MMYIWVAKAFLAIILCIAPLPAYGQDLDALKASFTAEITALDSKNLDAAVAEAHNDIVLFGVFSPFPIVGKAAFQKAVQEYFNQHEKATFLPVKPAFSIMGTAGVAWGDYKMVLTPKGGSVVHSQGRYIFTYAPVDGRWKLLSMHISPLR